MPYGKLDVYVEGAVQIQDTSLTGKGGLYCTLTVGTQVFSTPPITEGGAHPYFNKKFEFQIDRTMEQLMVQIYSEKTLTDDNLLGYCTILFKNAFFSSYVVPVTPYALTRPSGLPGGHIHLSLAFKAQPSSQRPAEPAEPSSSRSASTAPRSAYKSLEPPPGGLYRTGHFGLNEIMEEAMDRHGCAPPRPPEMDMLKQPTKRQLERALVGSSVGSLQNWDGDVFGRGGGDDVRLGSVATESSHKDQGLSISSSSTRITGPVASSSGHSDMEEYAARFMRKVQSKDLKSGRLIGRGPSSIVYETTMEGKRYARKDFLRVPSDVFEEEAAALVGLHHRNVVRTFCWTVDEGSCSLVLELMGDDLLNVMQNRKYSQRKKSQGSGFASQTSHVIDLHEFMRKDWKKAQIGNASTSVAVPPVYPFDMREALQIMLQIADGMKFLHDKGVVHGDLKPKNILVTTSGMAASISVDENMTFKVADFGLVGTKMESRSLVSRQARKMEMVRWRAPELLDLSYLREDEIKSSTDSDWDSDSGDGMIGIHVQKLAFMDMARADVYNFGLTCSQILHGEDPCSRLGVNDLVNKIILPGVRPDLPPTCPDKLRALIESCWGKKTERPSFEDIFSELKDLHESFSWTGSPITEPSSFGRINSEIVSEYSAGESIETLVGSETRHEQLMKDFQGSPITEPSSFGRIDPEIVSVDPEIVPFDPGIVSEYSAGESIETLVGYKTRLEQLMKDFEATPEELPQGLKQRKTFSCLGMVVSVTPKERSGFSRKSGISDELKQNADLSTPTKCSPWLKRRDAGGPKLKVPHRFSQHDIKKMTNNFNNKNVLGEDAYFMLYKGIQAGTGATVVVKRSTRNDPEISSNFIKNEIELLSRLHHNNVVGLLGFCFEKSEQVLVYDCVANGTLRDWLHGLKSDPPLDCDARLKIALDAAKGLAYLHDHADPPIIHRDVKPSNIFLDEKLNAKIALGSLSVAVTRVPFELSGRAGTVGYMDPVYVQTGCLSTMTDAYSFGGVLLELLTSRPPFSYDGDQTHMEVRKRFTHGKVDMTRIIELLDPILAGTREEDLETFVTIACSCSKTEIHERPSMHEVVNQLEALVVQLQTQKMQRNSDSSASPLSVGSYTK